MALTLESNPQIETINPTSEIDIMAILGAGELDAVADEVLAGLISGPTGQCCASGTCDHQPM